MNGLSVVQENTMTSAEIRAQVNLIQSIMKSIMKVDTHYGMIPGTRKNTLYKAGSEVLLSTFRISVDPEIEDLSTSDEIRYRIRARGIHQPTGILLGIGIGECSSNEEKYKWIAAVCTEQFQETTEDRRRIKYKKYSGNITKVEQIRAEPADIANTILKMAKKRAQIDLTLTATAASDIFTQDIEDMPNEVRNEIHNDSGDNRAPVSQPRSKSSAPANNGTSENSATEKQRKMIFARIVNSDISMELFRDKFGEIDDLQFEQVNSALAWVKDQTG